MHPFPGNESRNGQPDHRAGDVLADRVEALAAWIHEIDTRARAAAAATGDEATVEELRGAIEVLTRRDPKFEDRLTNRVDVLTDRLATLAKTLTTTAAALAA